MAVVGVIGYRFFNRGGGGNADAIVNGTVFLPKGVHIDSTTISEGRIVVTFDLNGATEVRFFDLEDAAADRPASFRHAAISVGHSRARRLPRNEGPGRACAAP